MMMGGDGSSLMLEQMHELRGLLAAYVIDGDQEALISDDAVQIASRTLEATEKGAALLR
jgi:hypothetical protein